MTGPLAAPATLADAGEELIELVAHAVERGLVERYGREGARAQRFKLSNITVDDGVVKRDHIALEVRRRPPPRSKP